MRRTSLPLPPHYFAPTTLLPSTETAFLKLSRKSVLDVTRMAQLSEGNSLDWTVVSDHKGVCIKRGVDPTSTHAVFCGSVDICASIDEVVTLFHDSAPGRFTPGVLDHSILATLVAPSFQTPRHRVTLQWAAYGSPVPFIHDRDACFLETHQDIACDGARGWVRALKSVCVPECPDLPGLVRMQLVRYGHVLLETDRTGYLHVLFLVQTDIRGRVPAFVVDLSMHRTCRGLRQLEQAVHDARLQRLPRLVGRGCDLCGRLFSSVGGHRRVHCRVCGHCVCKPCSTKWDALHVRICLPCAFNSPDVLHRSPSLTTQEASPAVVRRADPPRRRWASMTAPLDDDDDVLSPSSSSSSTDVACLSSRDSHNDEIASAVTV
ncbi:Aste57867_9639 [Aphanomyces stellatus]|uniref:Aste57867_9639 protein n=1 Tax=Aphanomyces stellatus TaxID=120398 RepID=A0A485KNH2_9STRA|nr:hypothetical protein As57867_009601 [Aphanomyces stellatus]VFT86518.1 Aste57867_9639 [Aphanomyces stellatus]